MTRLWYYSCVFRRPLLVHRYTSLVILFL